MTSTRQFKAIMLHALIFSITSFGMEPSAKNLSEEVKMKAEKGEVPALVTTLGHLIGTQQWSEAELVQYKLKIRARQDAACCKDRNYQIIAGMLGNTLNYHDFFNNRANNIDYEATKKRGQEAIQWAQRLTHSNSLPNPYWIAQDTESPNQSAAQEMAEIFIPESQFQENRVAMLEVFKQKNPCPVPQTMFGYFSQLLVKAIKGKL